VSDSREDIAAALWIAIGGATFVARSFSGDIDHLASMIKAGVSHKGFSLIDILQPCTTFNLKNTFKWYRERVYRLGDDHDAGDRERAFARAQEWGDRIPIGIIYNHEGQPTFDDQVPALKSGPLIRQQTGLGKVDKLIDQFL
jgi:2-oxoglutarate ferredoxin oxidoreductase subunit beta